MIGPAWPERQHRETAIYLKILLTVVNHMVAFIIVMNATIYTKNQSPSFLTGVPSRTFPFFIANPFPFHSYLRSN